MGIISATVHRWLDFAVVALFAIAPTAFHLTGNTRLLAFGLAAVHLGLTLLTHFPGQARGVVPFRVHGMIELAVGVVLVALPLLRHWTFGAHTFYIGIGVAILVVWALTRYGNDAPLPARGVA